MMAFLPTVCTLFLRFMKVCDQGLYLHSQPTWTCFVTQICPRSNKQTKTLSSLSASTTGKGEWNYKECNWLYRMAHMQINPNGRMYLRNPLVTICQWFLKILYLLYKEISWSYWENSECIKGQKGAHCPDKSMTYLGNFSISQNKTISVYRNLSLKHYIGQFVFTQVSDYRAAFWML